MLLVSPLVVKVWKKDGVGWKLIVVVGARPWLIWLRGAEEWIA